MPGCRGLHGAPRPRASSSTASSTCAAARDYGLRSNQALPAGRRVLLAHGRGPRSAPVRRHRRATTSTAGSRCSSASARGRTWACRSSSPTGRGSARWPRVSRRRNAFTAADEQLFVMLARVLACELERESNARDLRRFNDMLRDQAKGMGAIGRVAKALAAGDDARQSICEAAVRGHGRAGRVPAGAVRAATSRRRRWPASQVQPVTIQPRGDGAGGGKAFTAKEAYFVADARNHPALAAPLVEATSARSRGLRADPARRRGRRRADRHLAAAARGAARGRRGRAAAGRRAGRDRDRARGPAGARGRRWR